MDFLPSNCIEGVSKIETESEPLNQEERAKKGHTR